MTCLVVAFIPAAVIGKAFGDKAESKLLKPGPVAAAWIVGGVVILWFAWRSKQQAAAKAPAGKALESMTIKQAAIIGVAQTLALWPGVSRSFVTILAAVLVGLSLSAAVEFSFLLGLATLSAATLYELGRHGSDVKDAFGVGIPLIGVVFAFISAAVAVKWMVTYLQKRDLSVFGGYRILVGITTLILLTTSAL